MALSRFRASEVHAGRKLMIFAFFVAHSPPARPARYLWRRSIESGNSRIGVELEGRSGCRPGLGSMGGHQGNPQEQLWRHPQLMATVVTRGNPQLHSPIAGHRLMGATWKWKEGSQGMGRALMQLKRCSSFILFLLVAGPILLASGYWAGAQLSVFQIN